MIFASGMHLSTIKIIRRYKLTQYTVMDCADKMEFTLNGQGVYLHKCMNMKIIIIIRITPAWSGHGER